MAMNAIRLCGELCRLAAIVVLMRRLETARNAQGISLKTHQARPPRLPGAVHGTSSRRSTAGTTRDEGRIHTPPLPRDMPHRVGQVDLFLVRQGSRRLSGRQVPRLAGRRIGCGDTDVHGSGLRLWSDHPNATADGDVQRRPLIRLHLAAVAHAAKVQGHREPDRKLCLPARGVQRAERLRLGAKREGSELSYGGEGDADYYDRDVNEFRNPLLLMGGDDDSNADCDVRRRGATTSKDTEGTA
ncbi:hypothetical protein THAOC_10258 [Thalassiosira oceanica]|uniref:Uncharacterized protein n=1 Tax=Thalassiosira oceanica TaxID=159749 RepID=K0SUC4_THAOC|nr:hypothetical protein THAOC_10258 [Thalassiosira oceanica]|eukprot:EJK68549.1 hypothetical protein THAOC_10258 [Thalassiosira oceanica]